jgi:hypothetical protein
MKKILLIPLLLLIVAFAFGAEYTIGTGTGTQNYVPFYGLYNYSWSKTIYTKTEINAAGLTTAGNIDAIAFYVGNTPVNYEMLDQRVYIRHTPLATYGTASDETGTAYPNNANFTYVFQGNLVYNGSGWFAIVFSNPFYWDNENNIEILCENWDGAYVTGYPSFRYTATPSNTYMSVYKALDAHFPTTADGVGTRTLNRPNIQLIKIDSAPNPAVLSWPLNNGFAFLNDKLQWKSGGGYPSSYDVYLDTIDGTTLVSDNQTGTTYTPALEPGTTYYWKVIPYNSVGPATGVVTWSFKTPTTTQLAESFENTTFPPLGWIRTTSNTTYWGRSTAASINGTASMYALTSTTAVYDISTPKCTITTGSTLNFFTRATNVSQRLQILYSTDRTNWTQIGSDITYAAANVWYNISIDLSNYAGEKYLAFRSPTHTTTGTIYVDAVFGPEICPETPGPVTLTAPTNGAILVSTLPTFTWTAPTTGGIPSLYTVLCDASPTPITPTTPIGTTTGLTFTPTIPLQNGTIYYWTVKAENSAGFSLASTTFSFTTIETGAVIIGTGTTNMYLPIYPYMGYSYSQSIFQQSEINMADQRIEKISYYWNGYTADTNSNIWTIYMGHTTNTSFATTNSWISIDDLTQVFSGEVALPAVAGWIEIQLQLPFLYNNSDNLVVAVDENESGYGSSSTYFYGTATTGVNRSIRYNNDNTNPDPANPPAGTLTAGYPNVILKFGEIPQIPIISVSPTSWDFGQTLIRTTKTKNFTITNTGAGTLSIISIAIEGDYYTLLTNPAPIGLTAGQTAIFTVQYAPLATGHYDGTITITDNRGITTIELDGDCYDPTIYSLPWIEDFGTTGTTFPPEYWTRWSGLLTAEPVTLTSVSSYWIQDDFANVVTNPANKSAKINIFGTTYKYWFITPPIQIPDTGYQLEFDLALTDYNNPAPPDDPAGYSGVDDKFVVLIGDGNSWSLANAVTIWDNDPTTEGGIYKVYNSISYTGEHCIIPLNSYVGFKYIAFYGESTISNADNDLFVDNVMIRQTPSGAPDHVTLVSPANGATGLDPENIVLTWSPALTGGIPAYYQVMIGEYPIDPETGYFGDYQFDTENTNMNISAMLLDNLGFVLPYNTTWYWAVVPYNAEGEIPDLEAHEFMIWHFTTNVDPTITALSYAEYFDEVTAPILPWGWKAYVSSTSTSAYVRTYNSTAYAQSIPNSVCLFNSTDTSADLRLITPPINVPGVSLNQIKLKFYAYGGSGYTLLIGTVNTTDASGVFTQVASINPTATKTEYTVSFENYTGTDHYICFKHGLGGTSRSIYIDNVKIIKLQPADLAATALSGPALTQTGTSYNYTISIYNEGTAEQSSYTVNLKSGTQLLASLNVNSPLAVGAATQHTLIWTPQTAGIYPVYGEVVIAGDDNINNNATITINVNVADATVTVLSVGNDATTTSGYYLPLSMYYKNSVTEELYFNDEMHLQTGIITAIAYKNNFTDNIANKPVKIWMKCTTEQSLTTAWLSSENYTPVFDGTVNFPAGINYVVIPLDTPFNFTGGVLATRVNRPMDVTYYSSSNVFYYTNTSTEHPNRSLYLYSDSVVYDPLAPSALGTLVSNVPNTFFVVQNATTDPQAILQGYVRNSVTNQPIVGATVTLTERLSTTTDANGFYKFSFWTNKTVDLTVQKDTYYSQTITNIALTVGTTVTQNFNLVPLPRVTVSGIVTANDYPTGLVGATVKISGTENYETTTGTGGAFSIGNVLGSADTLSYALTVEKEGYQTYISALNVATTNVNVGTINLTEYLWTPYNLVATHSGNNVSLTWEPAGVPNYYFCDFESDNGGWVSSGYGDWQWGHYNLANYVDIDTYTDTPPQSAHSGTKMWGTVLNGGYSNSGAWSYLRQTFDLSTFTNPVLSIWHYMNGYNSWDYGLIKVNGNTVWGNSSSAVFMPWQQLTIDLSAYSTLTNAEISFEWYATTTVSYAGWYIDDIYIGPASRNIVTTQFASRSSQDRWFLNYSVYRFLTADEGTPANWNLLQTGVSDTTYMDTTFGTQPGGKYKWAVIANYSGGLQSNAIISNMLGKVSAPQNVVANRVANTVQLSWTADPGADYYIIYAADDPYGTFTVFGYSNTNSYTIVNPPAKKFFKIASADGTMPVAKEIEPPTKRK